MQKSRCRASAFFFCPNSIDKKHIVTGRDKNHEVLKPLWALYVAQNVNRSKFIEIFEFIEKCRIPNTYRKQNLILLRFTVLKIHKLLITYPSKIKKNCDTA